MFSDSTKELNPYNVTDNNVGKTADEMFQELGYHRAYQDTEINEKWYRKKENGETITLVVDGDLKMVECKYKRVPCAMEFQEILACAQLIKEMEEEK